MSKLSFSVILCMATLTLSVDPILRFHPLEDDRRGPIKVLRVPNISPETGKSDYYVYNYVLRDRENTPVVHLKLPQNLTAASNTIPFHVWGARFSVLQSELLSATKPDALSSIAKQLCPDYACTEQIRVMVTNRIGNSTEEDINISTLQRNIKSSLSDPKILSKYSKQVTDRFDEAYIKRSPLWNVLPEDFFINHGNNDYSDLFIRCVPYTTIPLCDAYFILAHSHGIEIKFSFAASDISHAAELHHNLDRLVRLFLVRIIER